MAEKTFNTEWVDRYVRNELSADEEEAFETALMGSADLQDELQAVLAVREAVRREETPITGVVGNETNNLDGRNHWQHFAMAASILLAVFSTTMYWKSSNDLSELQNEIVSLKNPRGDVLTIPINIMRSAGDQVPDVIVGKPDAGTLVVLDIEASPAASSLERLELTLRDSEKNILHSWTVSKLPGGRITTAVDASELPTGRIWLDISANGTLIDNRLIEVR